MSPPRNVHIAVVDDDDSFRAATEWLIRSLGFDVAGYESANSFLDMCTDRKVDCIISDINMPGLTGIELKQRLNDEGSNIPVIFVSAQTDPTLPHRVIACGGFALLQKPFQGQDLIDAMYQAIGVHPLD